FGTQDHKRLRRLGVRIGRRRRSRRRRLTRAWTGRGRADGAARREQNLILDIHRQPIAAAVLAERIRRLHLHCLRVDHGYAAGPVLEDLVDSALAIGDGLLSVLSALTLT